MFEDDKLWKLELELKMKLDLWLALKLCWILEPTGQSIDGRYTSGRHQGNQA